VNEDLEVLSPDIPFPFFSPSAFFWRGEAARLRQACGQGRRSQACRRRSPAHDAGPAGPGGHYQPTLRLLTTSGRHPTYETRVNRRGCDAEETRQNTKLLHRGTPPVRPRGPCAHS
jgi:hypothetical protein